MIDQNTLRTILLQAGLLYLATSVVQLEAKQHHWQLEWSAEGLSFAKVGAVLRHHMEKVGEAQINASALLAPGD